MRRKTISAMVTSLETSPGKIPLVYAIVNHHVRRTGTPVDNEDIIGEAFLGLINAIHKYKKEKSKLITYATLKIDSAVRDIIRREATYASRMPTEAIDLIPELSAFDYVEQGIHLEEVRRIVRTAVLRMLNDFEIVVVIQAYWQGWDNREIACDAGCSVSKINKTKQRALNKLRTALVNRGLSNVST